jgi:hypothetical protein
MVGKFNAVLHFDANGELQVCGPVTWEQQDADLQVKIVATLTQNGKPFTCSDNFSAPAAGSSFPVQSSWSMPLHGKQPAGGLAIGHATASANGNAITQWVQPVPPAITPSIVIQQ